MLKYLLVCALALAAACAQAGVGLTQLVPTGADGPVTVYYPSSANDETVRKGPFTLQLAPDGAPRRGNGRLVVISHGSGGSPWVHADVARTLVEAGFVVALPEHHADNYRDSSSPGPASWALRPAEVSRAIDAVAHDARFASLLATDKVGVYGGSAGGHTALELAGGRWSPAAFRRHCEAHIAEDFSSCVGFITRLDGNWLDAPKKLVALGVIRQRFDDETWHSHTDPRIAAALALVPFAADFDPASLAAPRIPLGLVVARKDVNQVPRFHGGAVLAICKTCELVADLTGASHGVMLSPLPPLESGSIAAALLADPPGFDRATVLPALDRHVVAFFTRHLLP